MTSITSNQQDKASSWAEYFTEFSLSNNDINEHTKTFLEFSIPSADQNAKLQNITNDKGDSILLYYSRPTKKIQLFHNLSNIGSTTWNPDPVIVALDGQKDKAIPVLLDNTSLTSEVEIDAPIVSKLTTLAPNEKVSDLEPPTNNPQKFKSLPFIMLPPFIWPTALGLDDKSPDTVFKKISNCIDDFHEMNKDDDKLKTINKKHCGRILTFIWAASKDALASINILPPGEHEEKITSWSTSRHDSIMRRLRHGPQEQGQPEDDVLRGLSSVIINSNDTLTNSISESIKNNNTKERGFDKLDDPVKNLILNASAPTRYIKATKPTTHCAGFFKQGSHGQARLNLIRTLKHSFQAETDIPSGAATSLFNGCFTRTFPDSPSNFSIFSFPDKNVIAKNIASECMILQIKEISGKGLTNEDIEAALKQGLAIPADIESMKYSFFNSVAVSKFFLGSDSLLTEALVKVYNNIVNNRFTYKALFLQKPDTFIAMFMYAVDTRLHLWLESCESASSRDQVDDSLLDFTQILAQVRDFNFSYDLPQSIRKVTNKKRSAIESELIGPPSAKKNKSNNDKVPNNGQITEWILDREVYEQKLRNNSDVLRDRPTHQNSIMCHRYHSRGSCFTDCKNKGTHIPSTSLSQCTKNAYKGWLTRHVSN